MANNPHDALFRFTFGQPENASALLRSCLSSAIAERIDWDTLALTQNSFVDASAGWRHSDLIFTAHVAGRPAFIYVLLEHQSSADPLMPLRVFGYIARLWDGFVRDNPGEPRLPAVLPVVVYHGESPWREATRLIDLVDLDPEARAAFAEFMPDLRFVLDDLTAQGEHRVRQRAMPVAALLTALSLLGFPKRDAIGILRQLAELFAALPANYAGSETLDAVVCYLLEVADPEPDPEQVRSFFERNVGPRAAEVVMSAAGRLREQGREEGLAEGLAEGEAKGRATTLLSLLTLKFGPVAEPIQRRVMAASIAELDALTGRVLTARSVQEVLDSPSRKPMRRAKKAQKKRR